MNIDDVKFKLEEAQFYIELLNALQETGQALTHINETVKEASFILSAILNAFYSVTEICGGKKISLVTEFRNSHPAIYAGSGKGGLRNTTVHVRHKEIDFTGYVPPKSGKIKMRFKTTPKLALKNFEVGAISLRFSETFYIYIDDELVSIVDFCNDHLAHLKNLTEKL